MMKLSVSRDTGCKFLIERTDCGVSSLLVLNTAVASFKKLFGLSNSHLDSQPSSIGTDGRIVVSSRLEPRLDGVDSVGCGSKVISDLLCSPVLTMQSEDLSTCSKERQGKKRVPV